LHSETPATEFIPIIKLFAKESMLKWIKDSNEYKNFPPSALPPMKREMFVRLSSSSCKDAELPSVVDNWEDAIDLIYSSGRCRTYLKNEFNDDMYICLRTPIETDIDRELRCFFFNGKLRAVTSTSDGILPTAITPEIVQKRVIPFFNRIAKDIPYYECVVDITILKDEERVILLEFNSWKVPNKNRKKHGNYVAGSYNFDWDIDYEILTTSETPVVRL
jgi:hypothetical protein